jgi:hypothetical protein
MPHPKLTAVLDGHRQECRAIHPDVISICQAQTSRKMEALRHLLSRSFSASAIFHRRIKDETGFNDDDTELMRPSDKM